MKQTLYYFLQAEKVTDAARQLIDYGAIGLVAFIAISGFVLLILLMRKKYERHLLEKDSEKELLRKEKEMLREEKNKEIHELKNELLDLRNEVRAMQNGIFREVLHAIERCNDTMDNTQITINETGSMLGRLEGFMSQRDDKMIEVFNRVIEKFK